MASLKNIVLILSNGLKFDYSEDLGLKLNKVVDDFQKPDKKQLEFSYTFNLPKTKNNTQLFGYADTKGRVGIFNNKIFDTRLVAGNEEILNGILELDSITKDSYQCLFYNRFSELIDAIKGKKLRSLTSLSIINNYQYERTIVNHIRGNYDINTTDHQYPLIFYRTYHGDGGVPVGPLANLLEKNLFLYNQVGGLTATTSVYTYQQFPPAVYLVSILQAIITEAGWTLSSTFFESSDIQKIIIPFLGSVEDYKKAIYSGTTGGTVLNINKVLPDMTQDEFLKQIVLIFNLYLQVDSRNKVLKLETFDTLFNDTSNAYSIDNLIISDITKTKERGNAEINLEADENNNFVTMYGRVLDYTNLSNTDALYNYNSNRYSRFLLDLEPLTIPYNANVYSSLWSKQGNDGSINLKLSPCNYSPLVIGSESDINGNAYNIVGDRLSYFSAAVPFISNQNISDNKGNEPLEDPTELDDWCTMNDPSKMKFEGKGLKLLYWYGQFSYDALIPSNGRYNNWCYINISTGGTCSNPTYASVKIPIASPYQLLTKEQYNILKSTATAFTETERQSIKGAEFHYLSLVYSCVGSTGGTHTANCTSFSLNFSDSTDLLFPNIYSFHRNKYDQVNHSHSISCNIRCNSNIWNELAINRTIRFDGELYRIVHIKNYDIANETAQIKLMKKV